MTRVITTWTPERLDLLRQLAAQRLPLAQMLEPLNALPGKPIRTEEAVKKAAQEHGIRRFSPRCMPHDVRAERVAAIAEMRSRGVKWREIGEVLGISPDWARDLAEGRGSVPSIAGEQPRRSYGSCPWVCCGAPAGPNGWCAAHARKVAA